MTRPRVIGTLQETGLHAALKAWYARPADEFEVDVDGFVIDLRRGEQLIEIQTRSFSAIKRKLRCLVANHPVRLVHPIPVDKWIVRLQTDRRTVGGRRKSPKHGQLESLFLELVSLPELILHPNFTLEVLLTREEEIKVPDRSLRWWRRGWRVYDRRLIDVVESVPFETPEDFRRFVPAALAQPFTSRELARAIGQPLYLAQKITYCLRKMGALRPEGRQGRALLYSLYP
jgi:hypothetical protein